MTLSFFVSVFSDCKLPLGQGLSGFLCVCVCVCLVPYKHAVSTLQITNNSIFQPCTLMQNTVSLKPEPPGAAELMEVNDLSV